MTSRIPNFYLIGAPKCGTTALAHYLSEHPEVFFCSPKEPFFWDTDHPSSRAVHQLWDLERYSALFAAADPNRHRVIGEGSTTYLQSHEAVRNVIEADPQAKFMVMLRDPAIIAHGMHGEHLRHFTEDVLDFEAAWRLQEQRARGESLPAHPKFPHQLQYKDVASIGTQLRRLFELVPAKQRLVVMFDDFVSDTRQVYYQTLNFLGLSDDHRTSFPRMNESRQYRSGVLGRLYHTPPALLERPMRLVRSGMLRLPTSVRMLATNLVARKTARRELSPDFRAELDEVFREEVRIVEELTGRSVKRPSKSREQSSTVASKRAE